MKNLGAKVTNYMDQAINKLETVLEQVDKGIGRTVSALDLVEQDISNHRKKRPAYIQEGHQAFRQTAECRIYGDVSACSVSEVYTARHIC